MIKHKWLTMILLVILLSLCEGCYYTLIGASYNTRISLINSDNPFKPQFALRSGIFSDQAAKAPRIWFDKVIPGAYRNVTTWSLRKTKDVELTHLTYGEVPDGYVVVDELIPLEVGPIYILTISSGEYGGIFKFKLVEENGEVKVVPVAP